jgi:membrane associated rhomboid family serine protease
MIPLADRNTARSLPVCTWALIAANVAVFVHELTLGSGSQLNRFFYDYAAIPCELTGAAAPDCPRVPGTPDPVWLTLFTSMFVHGGFLHIGGNMLFLWVFGDNVEDGMGHLKFLLFYVLCGLAAGWAQILVDPASTTPGLGASGAIAGVLAAYLLLYPGQPVRTLVFLGLPWFVDLPAFLLIAYWFVIQFLNGLSVLSLRPQGGVAYWAHIGGFLAGLLLARLFTPTRPPPRARRSGAYRWS